MSRCFLLFAFLSAATVTPTSLHANSYSFQGLGDLPGGSINSSVSGVSADGSVVVGASWSASGHEAFRWTAAGGMVGLGDLPGGSIYSSASGVSADGSVVVGLSSSASGNEAFRWTAAGGMVGLGDLPGGSIYSSVSGVSADGSVVVGLSSSASGNEAFRWTESGGMVGLAMPHSYATGVSADGSVVVGNSGLDVFRWTPSGGAVILSSNFHSSAASVSADGSVFVGRFDDEAGRWTASGETGGLGLPSGAIYSEARCVTEDGLVIVGTNYFSIDHENPSAEAFRWTEASGMVSLGDFPSGAGESIPSDVSADGSVIIGTHRWVIDDSLYFSEAFLWTEVNGMQSLRDVLIDAGVSGLEGWKLNGAIAISADGRTIVGSGVNPLGQTEAWIATVPEPGAIALGVFGLAAMLVIAAKKRALRGGSY